MLWPPFPRLLSVATAAPSPPGSCRRQAPVEVESDPSVSVNDLFSSPGSEKSHDSERNRGNGRILHNDHSPVDAHNHGHGHGHDNDHNLCPYLDPDLFRALDPARIFVSSARTVPVFLFPFARQAPVVPPGCAPAQLVSFPRALSPWLVLLPLSVVGFRAVCALPLLWPWLLPLRDVSAREEPPVWPSHVPRAFA